MGVKWMLGSGNADRERAKRSGDVIGQCGVKVENSISQPSMRATPNTWVLENLHFEEEIND
jgi:hypothetical protein